MKDVWRLLTHEAQDGYTNMAIDEAIMAVFAAGAAAPTIRFFRWQPACVSLGYFQDAVAEVDLAACRRSGIDVVRRPTGGRAILHDSELTYSLVASARDPLVSGSVVESYRKISVALTAGLRALDVPAEMKPLGQPALRPDWQTVGSAGAQRPPTAACFDVPSEYEITVQGRKLVGSAQTRREDTLLQHGSLLLEFDARRTFDLLRPPPGRDKEDVVCWLAKRVIALRDVLQRTVSFDESAASLRRGFVEAFDIDLVPGDLTAQECRLADELRAEKYATEQWNLRQPRPAVYS